MVSLIGDHNNNPYIVLDR